LPPLGPKISKPRPRKRREWPPHLGDTADHGTHDPETNVTGDDVIMTAKIARARLNEFPDYYTRLAKMEAEAEANGATPRE
jgi:Protein of unknown function (DUF5661)